MQNGMIKCNFLIDKSIGCGEIYIARGRLFVVVDVGGFVIFFLFFFWV